MCSYVPMTPVVEAVESSVGGASLSVDERRGRGGCMMEGCYPVIRKKVCMYECTYGWMDVWMVGWMNGWMDGHGMDV